MNTAEITSMIIQFYIYHTRSVDTFVTLKQTHNYRFYMLTVECCRQVGQCAAVFSSSFLCSVQIQVKSYLLRNEIGIGNQDYRDSSTGTVE